MAMPQAQWSSQGPPLSANVVDDNNAREAAAQTDTLMPLVSPQADLILQYPQCQIQLQLDEMEVKNPVP